jgi:hypothetical protein
VNVRVVTIRCQQVSIVTLWQVGEVVILIFVDSERGQKLRIVRWCAPCRKTLESFDLEFQPSIPNRSANSPLAAIFRAVITCCCWARPASGRVI